MLSGALLLQPGVYTMAEPGDALTQESTESINAIESTVPASDERDGQEIAENEVSEESGTEKTDTLYNDPVDRSKFYRVFYYGIYRIQ